MITVGSLFAGIGGIDLGLERAGMECVWQVEIDDYATKVLEKHWPNIRRRRDVTLFPPRPIEEWKCDLIAGGFPCQDISYAGKGKGLDGERSGLWWEFARIVRTLEPKYVLVENVGALLTRGIDAVLGTLASLGYDTEWHCIPAAAVGAPHIRDRVFILAYARYTEPSGRNEVTESAGPRIGRGNQSRGKFASCGSVGDVAVASELFSDGGDVYSERDRESPESIPELRICYGPIKPDSWWSTQCRLGIHPDGLSDGLDDCGGWECGIPQVTKGQKNQVDRLRCLGNAVVPQVAEWIGKQIVEFDRNNR